MRRGSSSGCSFWSPLSGRRPGPVDGRRAGCAEPDVFGDAEPPTATVTERGDVRVDAWLPLRADPASASRDNHPIFVVGMPLVPLWGVWADKYSRKAVIVRSALVEAVVFAVGDPVAVVVEAAEVHLGIEMVEHIGEQREARRFVLTVRGENGSAASIVRNGAGT